MKKSFAILTALITGLFSAGAQEVQPLELAATGYAVQAATTVTAGERTLRVSLQHLRVVAPPDEIVFIVESPAAINFKDGKGILVQFDNHDIQLKATCQAPLAHQGGVTEVASYHFSKDELKLMSAAKFMAVVFEGTGNTRAIFRISSPNILFKKYFEHSEGMERSAAAQKP
jgi:hypothetical protein